MKRHAVAIVSIALALAMLTGLAATRLQRARPDYADAHHAEVRRLVAAMPDRFGPYAAYDREVPPAAYDLLKPNATRARALYRDGASDAAGTVLIVHCSDANDLRGHYPPVCYPAQGYRLPEPPRRVELDLDADPVTPPIAASEYRFVRGGGADERTLVVLNFMAIPGQGVEPDDRGLARLASDYQRRFYGAGQVQVLVDPAWPPDRREAFYRTVLGPLAPIVEAMSDPTQSSVGS